VAEAFNQRELIKVRLQQSSPVQAREAGPALVAGLPGVEHVQTIGRTIVLYRPRPAESASDGGS
jgi:RNA-binding protein YhbY